MAIKRKKTKKKVVKRKAIRKTAPRKKKAMVKRKPVKKAAGRKVAKAKPKKKVEGKVVGVITHYFPKVRAAVVKLKAALVVGDTIKVKGHTTDFTQNITSLQIDRVPVNSAKKGEEIGLLVDSRVRQHDVVYKV